MTNIARYIDHTLLKPTATHIEINNICKEALEYGFAAVCVPPPMVGVALAGLGRGGTAGRDGGGFGDEADGVVTAASRVGTEAGGGVVKVATVIGFPFGYSTPKAKLAEVEEALTDGADELDIVINLIALRQGDWSFLKEEMKLLTERVHAGGRIVKVIIESGILQADEIIRCCNIYSEVGVDFLKTSTGYAEKGASVEAVYLMRSQLPAAIRIKASGGIRDYHFARQLIEAGAERLGCSASVAIVQGEPGRREDGAVGDGGAAGAAGEAGSGGY